MAVKRSEFQDEFRLTCLLTMSLRTEKDCGLGLIVVNRTRIFLLKIASYALEGLMQSLPKNNSNRSIRSTTEQIQKLALLGALRNLYLNQPEYQGQNTAQLGRGVENDIIPYRLHFLGDRVFVCCCY